MFNGKRTITLPRKEGTEYYVESLGSRILILEQKNGFKLYSNHIHEFKDSVEDFFVLGRKVFVILCRKGIHCIESIDVKGKIESVNTFNATCITRIGKHIQFQNPVCLTRILRLNTQFPRIISNLEPIEGFSEYTISSVSHTVPITLIHHKDAKLDTNSIPTLLTGYGAYGNGFRIDFDPLWLCLLKRGWMIAVAHVRGGNENGRDWHKQGKLFSKKNSFKDFISAANYLKQKITRKEKLACIGHSAGGLLVAASHNMDKNLCCLMILRSPFLDVAGALQDRHDKLRIMEFSEWGNPQTHLEYIESYSPISNIPPKSRIKCLLSHSLDDRHVPYWHSLQWTLRYSRLNPDASIYLDLSSASGHFERNTTLLKAKEFFYLLSEINDNTS